MQGIRRSLGPLLLTPEDKQSLRHSPAGQSASDGGFFQRNRCRRSLLNNAQYRFVLPIIFASRSTRHPG
jgi:hypothetical protein